MKMKILTVPHELLHRQVKPVEMFGPYLQALIDKMFITMYQAKGLGLAANQVGILKRIVVLNINHKPMVLINPYIRHIGPGVWEDESCLSIPGYTASVGRSSKIFVVSHNRQGKEQNFEANGLLARVIQHECDHLRGELINAR